MISDYYDQITLISGLAESLNFFFLNMKLQHKLIPQK